jgi:hypothetical protein
MGFFLWLVPVLIMIHEFEEIIMIEAWHERYKEKINSIWPQKKPFGLDHAGPYLTTAISIGVLSQLIVMVLVSLLCAAFDNYYVWYGFNVGFLVNTLLLHTKDVIKFKGYTPGIVTSAILFIPVIWILYQANTLLHYGVLEIILSTVLVNVLEMFVVFKLLHTSMRSWSEWLVNYAKGETGKLV